MPATSEKLYYKIGEACKELDIQPYVLRYWETEFPFLRPDKSKSGQRVYTADDLVVIGRIKELLYEEGYTIAGAKKKLESEIDGETELFDREMQTDLIDGFEREDAAAAQSTANKTESRQSESNQSRSDLPEAVPSALEQEPDR